MHADPRWASTLLVCRLGATSWTHCVMDTPRLYTPRSENDSPQVEHDIRRVMPSP
jgi:hypothetical protein